MTTRISSNNLDTTVTAQFGPKISSIGVTDNAYATIDDTAVSVAGGYIVISGSNFATGCTVLIGSLVATSVSFVNSTTVRAQVPAQSAGSYTVYLTNPDGGVAIRVNGLNYSATPTWSTTSPLPGSSLNSAFSIQLSASSNSTVTYALQAGSSLPAGVTLSNVGLLSGTVIGITVETTYNFTVVATDTELQDTPQAFSITISAGDPNFRSTTLLLSGNATTFVRDASTNNFNITIVGDTRPSNYSPYEPGYYSNFFDGTGDFLTIPGNVAFNLSSGSWTVECWFYQTSSKEVQIISSGAARWRISINTSQQVGWLFNTSSVQTSNNTAPLNRWNHVAVCYNGTTCVMYLNGVAQTATGALVPASDNTSVLYIGRNPDASGAWDFNGYISNARIVKGTAVYTANFTPPTAPLTAISGTSLLTCADNRFIDNSTNNFTITVNGNTTVNPFVPFVPSSSYATFGSGYFDGTGDYLTVPSNAAFNITSGSTDSFSCEAWVYFTTVAANMSIIDNGGLNGASFPNWEIRLNASSQITITWGNSAAPGSTIGSLPSSTVPVVGQWYHIALVKTNADWALFINGTRATNFNGLNTAAKSSSTALYIGFGIATGAGGAGFAGYISNVRIYNGATGSAPYAATSTTITVPTSPLTAIANTSLLTLQNNQPTNNSMFLDSGTLAQPVTKAGNATQGSFSPNTPGSWSGYFDGTGDYLSAPNTSSNFGTGDFTIEAWFYKTGSGLPIVSNQDGGTDNNYFLFDAINSQATIQIRDGGGQAYAYGPAIVNNTWTHIAVSRASGSVRVFVNGVSGTPVSITKSITSRLTIIGGFLYTGFEAYFTGYISNLRMLKGTALYTANFTPPITPLTAIANTSLLTLQDNRFMDDSANNFTITRVGDTRITNFSPFAALTQTAYYSNYFDGTATSAAPLVISTASGQLNLPGDFTIELWFYDMGTSKVLQQFAFQSSGGFGCGINAFDGNATRKLDFRQNGGSVIYGVTAITPNVWNHAAFVRSGTAFRIFLNGVLDYYNANYTTSFTSSSTNIGSAANGDAGYSFLGYISNFRIVNGTAVYTTSSITIGAQIFTPPTAPLTAIANTSLLTCQSATFVDNSTNNFAITVNGNPYPKIISPFTPPVTTAVQYSALTHGASAYFDGTGDYLSIADNPAFLITGDFTVEAWVYQLSSKAVTVIGQWPQSATTSFIFRIGSDGKLGFAYNVGSEANGTASTGAITYNSWNHVAWTRSGTTVRYFINGIQDATTNTVSGAFADSAGAVLIGAYNTSVDTYFNGYISDVRFIKGQALYTSSFVPPVQAITAVQNTVLLANFTGSAITDASAKNTLETVGDARINTVVSKFGGSSMFFDGTGDYLYMPNTVNLQFGTGDYTVEFWLNTSSFTGTPVLLDFRTANGATGGGIQISISTAGIVTVYGGSSTATLLVTASSAISTATWVHIALARASNSTRLFINGTQSGSTATDSTSYGLGALWVGSNASGGGNYLTGYIQDLRITKDIARYTANFTAPTAAFQQI